MPIEIRELLVRATVNNAPSASGSATGNTSAGNDEEKKEELIKACTEAVLEKLKWMNER